MAWWVAGTAAVTSLYSGYSSASSAAKQASAASNAENNAIARSNLNLIVRNSYKTSLLNMQLGQARKQAITQGHDITLQGLQVMSATSANTAASGTIGASVAAVSQDIEARVAEAQLQRQDQFDTEIVNYNNELDAMKFTMHDQIQQPRRYEYTGPSQGQIWGGALFAGASSFASSYAMSNMRLGLGPKPLPSQAGSYGSNIRSSFGNIGARF